jgi:hypothetical protein
MTVRDTIGYLIRIHGTVLTESQRTGVGDIVLLSVFGWIRVTMIHTCHWYTLRVSIGYTRHGRTYRRELTGRRPTDTTKTVTPMLAESATDHHDQSRFFDVESEEVGNNLDGFVAAVTTIAQSQCERDTDYDDIETLVCHLTIDQFTFTAHDLFAPYSGPYPMAVLVRSFIIEEINSWDETKADDRPKHQLVTEKTDEVWQQAKPFVTDAFALDGVRTGRSTRTPSGSNTPTWGCAKTCWK